MCQQKIHELEVENQRLKAEAESANELLDDIAALRAAKIAVKAIMEEAIGLLTDTEERTEADLDEAVRLLKQAVDY